MARMSLASMNCPNIYFPPTLSFPKTNQLKDAIEFEFNGGLNGFKDEISNYKWKWVSILFIFVIIPLFFRLGFH